MDSTGAVPRRRLPPAIHVVRQAVGESDSATVRALDDAAFPPDSPDQQRADPGELESGVVAGDVYLLERDEKPVAYLHLDRQEPGRVQVSGMAVHPDVQGGGLAKLMIGHFMRAMAPQPRSMAVVTVTSPRNHVMLSLLFAAGFAARWPLRDFFGPGRDRFGCQLAVPLPVSGESPEAPFRLVPADALGTVYDLMAEGRHVVRSIVASAEGPQFALSAVRPGEFLDCPPPRREAAPVTDISS